MRGLLYVVGWSVAVMAVAMAVAVAVAAVAAVPGKIPLLDGSAVEGDL